MANTKNSAPKAKTNKVTANKKTKQKKEDAFLIVGMGASAGGLEAFKEFFSELPDAPGMAFVIVQHLDPTHKSLMVDLLKKYTKMQVSEVKDHNQVVKDHVYIIPPNKDMAILNGILHLMEPTLARGFRKPIDFFLRSLANDQGARAVGIILSGTGTEGTLGLKDVKGHGGLTIVQDPKTAQYDGMPRSVITAGAQDFILPVKEIPKLLVKYSKNRNLKPIVKPIEVVRTKDLLEKVYILLRNETGCNFSDYKDSTVIRRVEKRMAINQIIKLENYIKYLQNNSEEVIKLFNELLIGVTSFFRDKEPFEFLRQKVIPKIIEKKSDNDTIRIWIPGCSTGEEAYTIAILFDEIVSKQNKNIKVQIFASDIDEKAINIARLGVYPDTIITDVTTDRLNNYFYVEGSSYRIKKEIRDQIIFAEHNLIKDPPFSKLDMISCRNLLIYLNIEAQKKVFSIFHYALLDKGILFLGSSESLGEYGDIFEVVDRKSKIFKRKNVHADKMPRLGYQFNEPLRDIKTPPVPILKRVQQDNLATITQRLLLAHYAPACAIIDSKDDAVYFSGNTGKYLQPSPGEARLNLIDMAREGLKAELRAIISKTRKSQSLEVHSHIKVKTNGSFQNVKLSVRPLNKSLNDVGYLMITFEDLDTTIEKKSKPKIGEPENISEINALEQELATTKEYLRSTIEQLEISNEELKSSNEELQSSNEELQSTNEELETSKEELQSVNEEIITVNTELQGKIDELALAYDDMNNLLASTDIGTIFLDEKLNIMRFTPSMARIINLIPTDLGRPVAHLSFNLKYDSLVSDIKNVLNKLTAFTTSVKSNDGLWYQMKIMPYITSQNVIKGVVITFVDITKEKSLVEELNKIKENYEHLLESTKTVVYTQDENLVYTGIINMYPDVKFRNIEGKTDKDFFTPKEAEKLNKIKNEVLKTGKSMRQTVAMTLGGDIKFHDLTVRPLYDKNKLKGIACTSTDITELSEIQQELSKYKE
ncbi:CheR family methyltransferase [Lutimonas vermicola]|uniref:protein-glutamate O-methyltransferase n=1 Tax=Lutimonas vermicola TaxID=414288 RepID=A0ABU9KW71_9FLAO